jgi:hypothetical protein
MPALATTESLEPDTETITRVREDYAQAVLDLFEPAASRETIAPVLVESRTSTFLDNMRLPIHRWFRYSAGFSAEWVKCLLAERKNLNPRVVDPFVGSGTTCLACDEMAIPSIGLEAHPFVYRIAEAKLSYRADPKRFLAKFDDAFRYAARIESKPASYPALIQNCFSSETLSFLDRFRTAVLQEQDDSAEAKLLWATLICSLRVVSHAGTAPWQYVLPGKKKAVSQPPETALRKMAQMIAMDIQFMARRATPTSQLKLDDARTCNTIADNWATFVITSPPYANNYDYADATRLEMTFMGEIRGWGDLQSTVRQNLVRACSQHVPPKSIDLNEILERGELSPIRDEIREVCRQLSDLRLERGGKKTYNNMVACYFLDMASVWKSLRRICDSPSEVCFVIGDSAPYGVYVPVVEWLAKLALEAGFKRWAFTKLRDRNIKWKNRKHRVPLCEGHLWVHG